MTGPRMFWPLLALLPLGLVLAQNNVSPAGGPVTLQGQLQEQQAISKRQQAALAEIRGNLSSLSAEEQATLKKLDTLNADIDRLRGQTGAIEAQLKQTEESLHSSGRDALALQTRVEALRRTVALNLGVLYRQRSSDYLSLLAQAQTLPELLLRLRWANYAGEQQVARIQELDAETARLQGELAAQTKAREDLQTLQTQRRAALDELAQRQAEAQTLLASLRQSAEGQRLLEVQGQAELQQTGENINLLVGAALKQRETLEAQRQRELQAKKQREQEAAARLRAAEAARERLAATQQAAREVLATQAPTPAAVPAAPGAGVASAPSSNPSSKQASQSQSGPNQAKQNQIPQNQIPQAQVPTPAPAQAQPSPAPQEAASAPAASLPTVRTTPAAPAPTASLPTPQQLGTARVQAEAQAQLTEAQLAPLRGQLDALAFPLLRGSVSEAYSPETPWTVLRGSGPAQAAADGIVLAVTSFSSLGWVVLLDNGGGLVTAYLGLTDPLVTVGERVPQGAALGDIGGSPVFGPDSMAFQVSRVDGDERTSIPPPF